MKKAILILDLKKVIIEWVAQFGRASFDGWGQVLQSHPPTLKLRRGERGETEMGRRGERNEKGRVERDVGEN